MATIEEVVLSVTNGLSSKFVPCPSKRMVLEDLSEALIRFWESLRWSYFFMMNPPDGDGEGVYIDST